jgi:hypothetical protein
MRERIKLDRWKEKCGVLVLLREGGGGEGSQECVISSYSAAKVGLSMPNFYCSFIIWITHVNT